MKRSFYIYTEGQLQRKDNTLRFTSLDGKRRDIPIEAASDLYIMTEMTLNTALLNLISKNEINTLISFVNSLIYTTVLSEIYKTQLNPTISYLHEPGVRRFSLSLDIAEIFKPLLGDRLIFSMLNRGQITKKDFTEGLNYMHLTKEGSRKIAREMNERLAKTIRHKTLQKDVSYRYLIRLECYKLIKDLTEEKPYEPFVIWW